MKRSLLLAAPLFLASSLPAMVPPGSYAGRLQMGVMKLRIQLNFNPAEGERQECTLDSPDQGAHGIPGSVDRCQGDSVHVTVPAIRGEFSGVVRGDTLEGKFRQGAFNLPLVLVRDGAEPSRRIQTPQPPYPYTTVDTVVPTADAGVRLGATLVLPEGYSADGNIPAVVFVSGSGLQNRDEELFGHKPFLVMADYLARHGIASLRYDDRGCGQSTGDGSSATTMDFAADAGSAVDFLKTVPGIGRVGVVGHSEGGTIAFMLGAEQKVDFLISLAGAILPGKEILLEQNRSSLLKSGVAENEMSAVMTLLDKAFTVSADKWKKGDTSPLDVDGIISEYGSALSEPMKVRLRKSLAVTNPWISCFLALDPADYIRKTKCPVMALNGEKDTQVQATPNLTLVGSTIPEAWVKEYAGLNHLFQHCQTGEITEYADIEETVSPEILTDMATFILSVAQ